MATHFEQTCGEDCGALCEYFIDSTSDEQNDSNHKRCNRLCICPLRLQIIGAFYERGTVLRDFPLTCCLTKVKTDEQADDTTNEANESNEIEFCKLIPNWAVLMGIKVEEREENSCCNTASGPTDGCEYERWASRGTLMAYRLMKKHHLQETCCANTFMTCEQSAR